ncbi:MAG: DMT family transporter [Myxococcota bacterium]
MSSGAARRAGLSWALGSAVGSALMAIPWKLANDVGTPAHSVFVLLLVAAIGNTLLSAGQRLRGAGRSRGLGWTDLGVAVGLAGFTLAGNHLAAMAVQEMSPSMMNLLLRSELPLTAVVAWILLGERVEGRFWVGTAIAMSGLVLLQGAPEGDVGALRLDAMGLAIASAACFGSLQIVTRAFVHRIDVVGVNAIRLWLAVGLWFVFNEAGGLTAIPQAQWRYATLAAICGPFLGRLTLMLSARSIEARLSSLVMLLSPVLTLVPAYLLLGDWPTDRQLLGGLVMLLGIAFPLWRRR